ncbi:conserved hypothetical protein [Paenibacillus curdlanolyticus YK9]|uniref:DUF7352 domain-containing protein n=1 Tax=Paenibacillus curdlanolyticus YK9 TaxID=717606 RepID=E0IBS0_9BACL|nr:hypothetical protein [Paenibacillus curdlanolyticus]EFM10150.1 conserved hypothetical protein [Paenibacillus curdlanolyticus YK9]
MSVIYKYPVYPSLTTQTIEVPSSSKIISAVVQNGDIVVYALVPGEEASPNWNVIKRIVVVGTGWQFHADDKTRFISTVQSGSLVWHVFELTD